MRLKRSALYVIISLLPWANVGLARIKEVNWHTPSDWDGIVDRNGRGLYIDLVSVVFKSHSIIVNRETVPWKRALHNVLVGRADFTGGQSPTDSYYLSKQPLMQGWELIFAKKGLIVSPALENVSNFRGVWPIGYIDGFPEATKKKIRGKEVANREQALRMVLSGRADYYLDNGYQMSDTIATVGNVPDQFSCKELFSAKVYMVFSKNERGKSIRDIFDSEVDALARSGELKKIYDKWHIPLPDLLDIPLQGPTRAFSCLEK